MTTPEIMTLANKMQGLHGHVALEIVSRRAEENRADGDQEAAELWTRVAAFIHATKTTRERQLALSTSL